MKIVTALSIYQLLVELTFCTGDVANRIDIEPTASPLYYSEGGNKGEKVVRREICAITSKGL